MYLIDLNLLIIFKCKLKMSSVEALVIYSQGLEILQSRYWINSFMEVLKKWMSTQPVSQVFQATWQNYEASSPAVGFVLIFFFPPLCTTPCSSHHER